MTVIFLYTYPTLLKKLLPLLDQLTKGGQVVRVVTATYHLTNYTASVEQIDETHDFQLYTRINAPEWNS